MISVNECERILRDMKVLLSEPFMSQEFVTTQEFLKELRAIGSYERITDIGLARLISKTLGGHSTQKRIGSKRHNGYYAADIFTVVNGTGGTSDNALAKLSEAGNFPAQKANGTGGTGGTGFIYVVGAVGVQAVKIGATACGKIFRKK